MTGRTSLSKEVLSAGADPSECDGDRVRETCDAVSSGGGENQAAQGLSIFIPPSSR